MGPRVGRVDNGTAHTQRNIMEVTLDGQRTYEEIPPTTDRVPQISQNQKRREELKLIRRFRHGTCGFQEEMAELSMSGQKAGVNEEPWLCISFKAETEVAHGPD